MGLTDSMTGSCNSICRIRFGRDVPGSDGNDILTGSLNQEDRSTCETAGVVSCWLIFCQVLCSGCGWCTSLFENSLLRTVPKYQFLKSILE